MNPRHTHNPGSTKSMPGYSCNAGGNEDDSSEADSSSLVEPTEPTKALFGVRDSDFCRLFTGASDSGAGVWALMNWDSEILGGISYSLRELRM